MTSTSTWAWTTCMNPYISPFISISSQWCKFWAKSVMEYPQVVASNRRCLSFYELPSAGTKYPMSGYLPRVDISLPFLGFWDYCSTVTKHPLIVVFLPPLDVAPLCSSKVNLKPCQRTSVHLHFLCRNNCSSCFTYRPLIYPLHWW